MIELTQRTKRSVDLRAHWDNSEDVREAVRDDLYEWGGAQRGALPDLGYPHKQNFAVAEERPTALFDPDKIDEMDSTFRFWAELVHRLADPRQRRQQQRMMAVIRSYFIAERPAEAIADRLGVSRATVYRTLGDAMYRFWALHDSGRGVYVKPQN